MRQERNRKKKKRGGGITDFLVNCLSLSLFECIVVFQGEVDEWDGNGLTSMGIYNVRSVLDTEDRGSHDRSEDANVCEKMVQPEQHGS